MLSLLSCMRLGSTWCPGAKARRRCCARAGPTLRLFGEAPSADSGSLYKPESLIMPVPVYAHCGFWDKRTLVGGQS